MKKNNWPKISITILTFNDEKGVMRSLESVKKQDYPKDKVEIIVIDNGSKDNSVNVAKKYTKNVTVSYKSGYINRADSMRKASGEFIFMQLEQDMELKSKLFLQKMVKPLIDDPSLVASFTRYWPNNSMPLVTRFISYDPIQRDPLFEYLTPSLEKTIIQKRDGYYLCKFDKEKLPPVTHMLFRKAYLVKTDVWKQKRDFDLDTVHILRIAGYKEFAYVPDAGIYHYHASNLVHLIQKRVRNLTLHYFPFHENASYKWANYNKIQETLKLGLWVIYANLFFPAFIRGMYRSIKYKDFVLLLEPIITLTTTDIILLTFLRNSTGRSIIKNALLSLFRKNRSITN